jgi:hypothetical protein
MKYWNTEKKNKLISLFDNVLTINYRIAFIDP